MMICISFCLALLALVAGMFLLAKTQKASLGMFFKVISYFVITASLICLLCCIACHFCGGGCNKGCATTEHCEMDSMHNVEKVIIDTVKVK